MSRALTIFMALSLFPLHTPARTLEEAAQRVVKKLPTGICVVTAESVNGKVSYAVGGDETALQGAAQEKLVFEIGSISKVFTGLLLAQAVVEKKVTLETTLRDLLGDRVTFADARVAAITLKQLSTHTSGLPRLPTNMGDQLFGADPYAAYDEKLLYEFLTRVRLEKDGPFTFGYSNLGAGLLGHLLGGVYGLSWGQAVQEKICAPLGLKDTAVTPRPEQKVAVPHADGVASSAWHFSALAGAGALRSTAADMVTFGQALLHPEKTPLREAFALALQPQAVAASMGGQIGLGIFMTRQNGENELTHDGGTGGYRAGLQVLPEKGVVRVVLTNHDRPSGSEFFAAMAEPRVAPRHKREAISLPDEALKRFTGVYELDHDLRFTVLLHQGQLWVRLTRQTFLPLFPSTAERFFARKVEAEVAFAQKDGVVQSLTLYQNGRELTAMRSGEAPVIHLRTAAELKPYAGLYKLLGVKKLTVTVQEDTLFAQLEGQPALPVFEVESDKFEYEVVKARLVFTRDEKKAIVGVTLLQNGKILPALKIMPPATDAEK